MIELACPKCGANLAVNAALNQAYCNYCGTGIYIDKSKDYVSMRMADAEYSSTGLTIKICISQQTVFYDFIRISCFCSMLSFLRERLPSGTPVTAELKEKAF